MFTERFVCLTLVQCMGSVITVRMDVKYALVQFAFDSFHIDGGRAAMGKNDTINQSVCVLKKNEKMWERVTE